jgi:hypothetical protein
MDLALVIPDLQAAVQSMPVVMNLTDDELLTKFLKPKYHEGYCGVELT